MRRALFALTGLLLIGAVDRPLADELEWSVQNRQDKLTDQTEVIASSVYFLEDNKKDYIETSIICTQPKPEITFKFIHDIRDSDRADCDSVRFLTKRGLLGGEGPAVRIRFDNGEIEETILTSEYCNSGEITLFLCENCSNDIRFFNSERLRSAKRLRFQLELANGIKPIIDINFTDPVLKQLISQCPATSQMVK